MRLIKKDPYCSDAIYIVPDGNHDAVKEKLYRYEEIADEPKKVVSIEYVLSLIDSLDNARRESLYVVYATEVLSALKNHFLALKGGVNDGI